MNRQSTVLEPDIIPARRLANGPRTVKQPVVFVIDDEPKIREALRTLLEMHGRLVEDFASCEDFLASYRPDKEACLLLDVSLPRGMNGLELLRRLKEAGHHIPVVILSGSCDVAMAVQAMKSGATDFIEKPVPFSDLLVSVDRALERARFVKDVNHRLSRLTERESQIMKLVLDGSPSKNIAADLGISQRTVENHRHSIMKKTGARSLPALARLVLWTGSGKVESHFLH